MTVAHEQSFYPNMLRLHQALVSLGADTEAIYRSVRTGGIPEKNSNLTTVEYLRILNKASIELGMPALGLAIAQKRTTADLGLFGHMLLNSPDFKTMVQLANKYLHVQTPGAVADLQLLDSHAVWTYGFPQYSDEFCRQDVELSLMEFITLCREVMQLSDWRPERVFFAHSEPPDSRIQVEAISDSVIYGHRFSGVCFPREFLDFRISGADPTLLQVTFNAVDELLREHRLENSLVSRVSVIMSSMIGKDKITTPSIARRLCLSRSTLQRQLAAEGVSIGILRDRIIRDLATDLLTATAVPVAEISDRLGFSDTAAFIRSFRRITGKTPGQYRRGEADRTFAR